MNNIIPNRLRECPTDHCTDIEFQKQKILAMFTVFQKEVKPEGTNHHAVISNANTSCGIKISTFVEK